MAVGWDHTHQTIIIRTIIIRTKIIRTKMIKTINRSIIINQTDNNQNELRSDRAFGKSQSAKIIRTRMIRTINRSIMISTIIRYSISTF